MDELYQHILDTLDMNTTSKDMRVLSAILKSQRDPTDFVSFEEIGLQLTLEEGRRRGKDPTIYRSLSALQQMGYLEVESRGKKRGYRSNALLIQTAIQNRVERMIPELTRDVERLTQEIDRIEGLNVEELMDRMINEVLGEVKEEKPLFAAEWQGILWLIEEKIATPLRKGDLVRITLDWIRNLDDFNDIERRFSQTIYRQGIEFRVLEHRRVSTGMIDKYREVMRRLHELGNSELRLSHREDATYQFISLGRRGIILITSEQPMTAVWIPRESNPHLIDDAIDNFDADFDNGTDVFEYQGTGVHAESAQ
ncbi:MAG: hypothetical protein ACP6KW_10490 [Candidatus Thorarchaeota archaeon]